MLRFTKLISLILLVTILAGCGAAFAGPAQVVQSAKPRESAPQVAEDDRSALAEGNAAFALDLYHALNEPDGNLFYSPYSISLALAMTYAGARGETERQMAQVMHYILPRDRLHPAFNALDQELATRKDAGGEGADGKGFRLNIVNDIWGQKDYVFLPDFLDMLAANYGAGLRTVDFQSDPEKVRGTINDYIAQKTEQRIKDLIPQGALDSLTRLVLTNAIYFNAAWKNTFEKDLTQPGPFALLDGSTVDVDMMKMPSHESMAYVAGDGYQAVALPYENPQLSMLLLVPEEGRFAEFAAGLDAARLAEILSQMQHSSVMVSMPKFQMEDDFSLVDALSGMGMTDAFDPGLADFSGMDGSRNLYIGDVIHKSFVKVDEAGTEAAAATAVIMELAMAPVETVELVVDRPFLFLIRDETTGTILFVGQVTNPS